MIDNTSNFTLITYKNGEIHPHWKSKAYPMWRYYKSHSSRLAAQKKRYHAGYKVKCAEYYQNNKEHKNEYDRNWKKNHPGYQAEADKLRRKINPGKVRSRERIKDLNRRKRHIYKHLETEINNVYDLCPKELVVDHIIPLQGKNISGLHVPWNLQYLTPKQNNFKRAKFDGTYNNNSWKGKSK